MDKDIFEEINHWLRFIERWEKENEQPVPETALNALEYAIEKAIRNYRNNEHVFKPAHKKDDRLH